MAYALGSYPREAGSSPDALTNLIENYAPKATVGCVAADCKSALIRGTSEVRFLLGAPFSNPRMV